jgi:hypothetical protein
MLTYGTSRQWFWQQWFSFLEASSLASRDEMRALAAAKSSTAQEGKRKLNKRVTEAQR